MMQLPAESEIEPFVSVPSISATSSTKAFWTVDSALSHLHPLAHLPKKAVETDHDL
jgi:hypothetical protein